MTLLNTLLNNNVTLPFDHTQAIFLKAGVHGESYYLNQRVFKITANYNNVGYIESFYAKQSSIFDYLIKHEEEPFVKLFNYGFFGEFKNSKSSFISYYYVMENLNYITQDEGKVFHSLLSHEDRNISKNYSMPEIKKIIKNLQRGLDFSDKAVILFCDEIKKSNIMHFDIHPRNIMKDKMGKFKLIDLDTLYFKTIENI